jgi:hypothetical protein
MRWSCTARSARGAWGLIALLGACTLDRGPRSTAAPVESPAPRGADSGARLETVVEKETLRFEGMVRVPAESAANQPGKKFRGAFLEQDDGTRWVLDYRVDSPFHALADRRVRVEGRRYEPPGQALIMPHLRVTSMKIAKLEGGPELVEVHGEEQLTGRFEKFTWEPGTKLAGETTVRFVVDGGGGFFIAHGADAPPLGKPVTVHAYRVEPSPFVARPGGPYLWIMRIDAL